MEGLEIYDWSRLIFITFIICLIGLSIILLFQGKRTNLVNGFTITFISIVSIFISGIQLVITGYIADELGIGGDIYSSYMFLTILGLTIVNSIIYFKKKEKQNK
ncbi:hypothetical protein KDN24_11795 [Bacillus sp. Bva_UNVM-123]|uniref:hypothetical protein n=1 Tax=Bacillus sp. Bva_UNVM-123 TaxID=2829798 RepID=UPI00391F223A